VFFVAEFLPPVVATLLADTKEFTAKMDGAIGKMAEVDAASATAGARIQQNLGKMALATIGIGVGFGAVGVKMAVDFQSSMTKVQNSSGMGQQQIKQLADAFLGTAFKSEFSAEQLATAFAGVAGQLTLLNGHVLTTKQTMDVMRSASDLAVAKNIDLASSTQAVVSAMKVFQTPLKDVADATNQLYIASDLSGTSIGGVVGQYTKLHAALGISIPSMKDMNVLMADMNNLGVGQGRTMMKVQQAIGGMLDPTKKWTAAQHDLTGNIYTLDGHFIGMSALIDQMSPKFKGMTDEQAKAAAQTLGWGKASDAMIQIMRGGSPAYDQATQAVERHVTVVKAAQEASKNFKNELSTLEAGTKDVLTQVGLALLPAAQDLMNWAKNAIDFFKAHPLISEIASDAAIGAFALAVAFKVGKAMKSVWDVGVGAFNTIKDLFTGGVKNTPLDLNTIATQENTDALLGKTGVGAAEGAAGGAAGGAGLGAGEGAVVGAAGGAGTILAGAGAVAIAGVALGLFLQSQPNLKEPNSQGGSAIYGGRAGGASAFLNDKNQSALFAPTGAQINHAGRQGGNAGAPNLPPAPLALLPGTKVGIQGIVGTDLNSAGVAVKSAVKVDIPKGVSISNAPQVHLSEAVVGHLQTTATNSAHLAGIQGVRIATATTAQHAYHLAGIPGIRSSTSSTADNTSQIARALSKTNKVTVTARFT
jgi:TP901 family phage tail tape measure protein